MKSLFCFIHKYEPGVILADKENRNHKHIILSYREGIVETQNLKNNGIFILSEEYVSQHYGILI